MRGLLQGKRMTERRTVIDDTQLAELQAWQGRSEMLTDEITAAPMRAMSATLDRDDAQPGPGTEVPPLWHWLYFLPRTRLTEIRPDGNTPLRSTLTPPIPMPRRMWAGGRFEWHRPLCVGDRVRRVSSVKSVTHKKGRSGELVFLVLKHEVHGEAGHLMTEEQDFVYRPAAAPGDVQAAPVRAEQGAPWSREMLPQATLLFRYSALIFNGHRIHYDRAYATEVEGYPGLLVHGPLLATLLADLLRRQAPEARLCRFEYKAVRPTFDLHPFRLHGRPDPNGGAFDLWAADHEGYLTVNARAYLA
jgi:3-methylfumaryl-CoA hydratase